MGPFGRASQEKTPKKKLLSNESEPSGEAEPQAPIVLVQSQPQAQPQVQPRAQPQAHTHGQPYVQLQSHVQAHLIDYAQAGPPAQSHSRPQARSQSNPHPQDPSQSRSRSRSQPRSQPQSRPQSQAQSAGPSQGPSQNESPTPPPTPPPPTPTDSSDSEPRIRRLSGTFNMHSRINQLTFTVVQKYQLDRYQWVIVARNKMDPEETVSIRLRVGQGGYSQWLNELYVYLLPKFRHENILHFKGLDKTALPCRDRNQFSSTNLLEDSDELYESESRTSSDELDMNDRDEKWLRPTVDYWLLNDYGGCITLRHYLMMHTITWPQLIKIMRGIMSGLDFLHEYSTYRYRERRIMPTIENYIRSTRGALKKVRFLSAGHREIHMVPPLLLTVVHRNLSSLNIVLREDFTPCIWNFGFSCVYHPFQAINCDHYVTKPIKNMIMSSPYSPPEVLKERGIFTLPSMKAIDMYASGIILWELMTRCVLPKLEGATPEENLERTDPDGYCEPFQFEFRCPNAFINPFMLRHAVCRLRTRPFVKRTWLLGKKTNRMVQIMRELWDHDAEARIAASTVIDRLDKTSVRNHDRLYKYNVVLERAFDIENRQMWPAETETHMAPLIPDDAFRNMLVEDLGPPLDEWEDLQDRGPMDDSSDSDSVPLLRRVFRRR